ncbi:MAG: O-antigen ligase family protein [Janthinobacterium lividum]
MGTGIGHFIPTLGYLGFWVAIFVSLFKKPLFGFYYMLPFLPYRTLRDHFIDLPLGGNVLTILVLAVVIGALLHGKRLPKSKLYLIWLVFGFYLYLSMWMGAALTPAPAPIWLSDANFTTWKDYMLMPLVLVAAALVLEDRKAIRTTILVTAISVLLIDRSSLMESLSHSWANFDENKRSGGPLAYGSNQTAAFLSNFAMFFWGFGQFLKRVKLKLFCYATVTATLLATMYCFSRGAYLALVVSVILLGILKDRKLILISALLLFTWQAVLPTAVTQRVNMTHDGDGQLEASAQERVDLWTNAEETIEHYPIFGTGFATFQFGEHVANLKDTHNWYVKVLVETGVVGMMMVLIMLQQMFALSIRVFRRSRDPLYRGLGLGLIVCMCSVLLTNAFGDRWTYLEINGLLWVLIGAAVRAESLSREAHEAEGATTEELPTGAYAYAG